MAITFLGKYPTLLRVYFARAIEYRAVIFIWTLTSVLPLVMMAAWLSLAADGPVGGFSSNDFVSYYLGVLVTRRFVGVYVVWDLDRSIREGEMSAMLLRPLHPFHYDMARVLANRPLNVLLVLPPVAIAALLIPGRQFDVSPVSVTLYLVASLAGLLIALLQQWCVGCLAFWWSHVTSLEDAWFIFGSFLGGTIVPLALLPGWLGQAGFWLPFRYTMGGFQTELMIGRLGPADLATGFALQGAWLLFFGLLLRFIWGRGVRQYSAVGA